MVEGLSFEIWLGFVATCVILAATPGPAMSLFMANTASHGTRAGMLSVIGNAIGLSALVTVATFGLSSVMTLVSEWFEFIRWIGVAYLVFLGVQKLRNARWPAPGVLPTVPAAKQIVPQAIFVALSNPKALLFLGAFLPQFINLAHPTAPQLTVLAVSFVFAITLTDAALVLAASSARALLTRKGTRLADAVSGTVLLGGGILLASIRR